MSFPGYCTCIQTVVFLIERRYLAHCGGVKRKEDLIFINVTVNKFIELFFCKKIPLSRRVGYVMGGSVSGSVRDVCNTNQIGCTIKHPSNFLL